MTNNEAQTIIEASIAEDDNYVISNGLAWVSTDGSFGLNTLVLFRPDSLTQEQWEGLENESDSDKFILALDYLRKDK